MSNRQARREESRTQRQPRQRSNRPPVGRQQPKRPTGGGGSNGPAFLSRPYLLGVATLIIVLAAVLGFIALRDKSSSSSLGATMASAASAFPYDLANGATVGKADAPLKLTQFEDFQCPFCLKYTATVEPKLIEEYVKTGKMSITYKHLPALGVESVLAARAAVCATDQNKFWQFHQKAFQKEADAGQDVSEKTNVGRFNEASLKQLAADIGLDTAKFNDCLSSPASLQGVTDQNREATALGFNGTPSFSLNGQSIGSGALAIEDFRKTLDQAYDRLTGSPTPAASASASATAAPSTAAATSPAAAPSTAAATSPTAAPTR